MSASFRSCCLAHSATWAGRSSARFSAASRNRPSTTIVGIKTAATTNVIRLSHMTSPRSCCPREKRWAHSRVPKTRPGTIFRNMGLRTEFWDSCRPAPARSEDGSSYSPEAGAVSVVGRNERGRQLGRPFTSGAVARPSASPLPAPSSADRGGRNRGTGTRGDLCHREVAQGSRMPRNRGRLVVQPGPWPIFKIGNFKLSVRYRT